MKDFAGMKQYSEQLCDLFKEALGENSDEFADALYLRAKAVFAACQGAEQKRL